MTATADVEKLCKLMVAHGLVELHVGDVHLRRAPPEPKVTESNESALERLRRLRPDQQDAALMLTKTGGG
ncbi:MAG TPA: HD domain-containing protein [Polyangiaceae bacterium]|nr:HD domain-containing protein [Polyangiaceae bacterium]